MFRVQDLGFQAPCLGFYVLDCILGSGRVLDSEFLIEDFLFFRFSVQNVKCRVYHKTDRHGGEVAVVGGRAEAVGGARHVAPGAQRGA